MIIEEPLFGRVQVETTPSNTAFTWTDHTAYLSSGQFSSGGRMVQPGYPIVDAGNLTVSFVDLPTLPAIGSYIRLRRYGTTEYFWTGFVQDVTQTVQYDQSVSLLTPRVITTLICLDWVGLASQFHVNGVTGKSSTGVASSVPYTSDKRVNALNYAIDDTMGTAFVTHVGTATGDITHTDFEASVSEHLDLLANSVGGIWYAKPTLPTNNTTGRDDLVEFRASGSSLSGKTFTDEAGSAGDLHYTDITIEAASTNVINSLNLANRSSLLVEDADVTTIGGTYRSAAFATYVTQYNTDVTPGLIVDNAIKVQDDTSIAAYGERYADVATNMALVPTTHGGVPDYNLVSNPNLEYSGDGWITQASESTIVRRKPMEDEATPFAAYDGDWAMRIRAKAAIAEIDAQYRGSELDGTPIKSGSRYRVDLKMARSSDANTDIRSRVTIQWRDDSEDLISTTYGSWVTLSTGTQWYSLTVQGLAPSTAVRTTIRMEFTRAGGGNLKKNDRIWMDALNMYRVPDTTTTMDYFTGDTPDTNTYLHYWCGDTGASVSARVANSIKTRGDSILADTASTTLSVSRVRWNAQEDLTAVSALTVGKTVAITHNGDTGTYRIVGVDGTLDPNRLVFDYYVKKVS